MIQHILKKDLKSRKSVNIILFLFITISSVFLSSSVNNILVVTSSVDYYMDYANIPDVNLITAGVGEKQMISEWIEEEAPGVDNYEYNTMAMLSENCIDIVNGDGVVSFDTAGASLYIGTMDVDYCKVFDMDGREIHLKTGEVAVSRSAMERNHLSTGDSIIVTSGSLKKEFTVAEAIKDAAYGSEVVGMCRIIVSPQDYQSFENDGESNLLGLFYVDTVDRNAFVEEMNNKAFLTVQNSIVRDTYSLAYSFDMIMAALLILIGLCLILIALLVLRFTLVFTMEEDYREIGIMKAIGMKNYVIKRIYLVKYMFLVVTGALLGLLISVPVSKAMVGSVSKNMIMEDSSTNFGVNILCTVFIILFVMLFCYGCTRKLNRVSAISAIRSGHTGERFGRRAGLLLHTRRRMPVPVYLGLNDILSHLPRYLVLMITFSISFILITIPLNTINTMKSTEMVEKFAINPESKVFLSEIEGIGESTYQKSDLLKQGMDRVEEEMEQKGYEAKLTGIPVYFFPYKGKGEEGQAKIMTCQILGPDNQYLTYKEGDAPVLSNEIAFSESLLKEKGWEIGDTVETSINGQKQKFIITGSYSDYMQLGKSARLNPVTDCSDEVMFNYWSIMVNMDTDKTSEELVQILSSQFPDYEWSTAQDVIDRNVGGVQQSLQNMLLPMTSMLCAVVMLITLLMERLFIVREKGEIAMMKSMGFKNRTIRIWQVMRMSWVALISMFVAAPLSLLSNKLILKPIFAIMGADVDIQIVLWQVYGLYPGILLLGIITATFLATRKVKKINIREMNHLE